MSWGNIIVIAVIILIIAAAIFKIVKDKRAGKKCTGCSDCGKNCPYQ